MKTKLLLLFILSCATIQAQEIPKFEITKQGIESIVVNVDSLSKSEMYNRIISWTNKSFKNPKEVIVGDVKDESIRINGFEKNSYEHKIFMAGNKWGDVKFTIFIEFKEGKYRLKIQITKLFDAAGNIFDFNPKSYYKGSGDVRKGRTLERESLNKFLNKYSTILYEEIIGKAEVKDKW